MDFSITKEQKDFIQETCKFVSLELNDGKREEFSYDKWIRCADFGLFGLNIDEKYGGLNMDYVTTAMVYENFGYSCEDSGFVFAVNNHVWVCLNIINTYGDENLKQRYLSNLVQGNKIGAFAITECDSGSDSFGLTTSAEEHEDYFLLNGSKMFISNGPIADLIIVIAKIKDNNSSQTTAFVVEKGYEGLLIGKEIKKMGLAACPMSEISFENCKVPKENILYKKNMGNVVANYTFQMERIFEFATHVGAMRRQMETCIKYVDEREQFGEKIKQYESVTNKIADMKVKVELAKTYLYQIAWKLDKHKMVFLDSAIFKLFVSESYVQACLDSLQIHGAFGYSKEYTLEQEVRDSIASKIYSGTNEIQRNIIFSAIDN